MSNTNGNLNTKPQARTARLRADGQTLTQLRLKKGLSQEGLASEIGITKSQITGYEKGNGIQQKTVRKLAAYFKVPEKELVLADGPIRLLAGTSDVQSTNLEIVQTASEFLYAVGSRSHDTRYLSAIEGALAEKHDLIHRRILFGRPNKAMFLKHLLSILRIRADHLYGANGAQTLGISIYQKTTNYPTEAAICMNERKALYVLPSVISPWNYDTAVVFEDKSVIDGWRRWIEGMYRDGVELRTISSITKLGCDEK